MDWAIHRVVSVPYVGGRGDVASPEPTSGNRRTDARRILTGPFRYINVKRH